jgi:hypothetical protein
MSFLISLALLAINTEVAAVEDSSLNGHTRNFQIRGGGGLSFKQELLALLKCVMGTIAKLRNPILALKASSDMYTL